MPTLGLEGGQGHQVLQRKAGALGGGVENGGGGGYATGTEEEIEATSSKNHGECEGSRATTQKPAHARAERVVGVCRW